MKSLYTYTFGILRNSLFLFVFIFCAIAPVSANHVLYLLDSSDNIVAQSDFVDANINVGDEMTTLVAIPSYTGDVNDYRYYVEDTNNLPDSHTDIVSLSTAIASCASGEIKLNIYTTNTANNYFPHGAVCMDTQEYKYGMVCWDGLAANCDGKITSASSHVFTGSAGSFLHTFTVNSVSGGFKLLKSPDGT
ncbi:MAG: hypothetical protein KBH03_06020, partial [Paludibacteraceae bacterium]|nr:hypothetical protein [Paludibacteraceae bacterium]